MNILNKLIQYIKARKAKQKFRDKLKRMIVVNCGLILGIIISIIIHNVFYAIFGFEDLIFLFIAIGIGIFLPFYISYSLITIVYCSVKK